MENTQDAASQDAWTSGIISLRDELGLDFNAVRKVLKSLEYGPKSVRDLVLFSGINRQLVLHILRELNVDLNVFGAPMELDGPESKTRSGSRREILDQMGEVRSWLSPDKPDLDHVSALAETMVDRAELLTDEFDLDDKILLCVGDHDLTSVSATLTNPSVHAIVVDIDPDVLAVIHRAKQRFNLNITIAQCDLRFGLPPAFEGSADIAFTDPPYSPEGMNLFLSRSLEGMKLGAHERIAFAYSSSRRQLGRTFEVQREISSLGLVYEAIYPDFNKFEGAEAIGGRSDLYICRPTKHSRSRQANKAAKTNHIYTRGAAAVEGTEKPFSETLLRLVGLDDRDMEHVQLIGVWPGVPAGNRISLETVLNSARGSKSLRGIDTETFVDLLSSQSGNSLPATCIRLIGTSRATVVTQRSGYRWLSDSAPFYRFLKSMFNVRVRNFERHAIIVDLQARDLSEGSAISQTEFLSTYILRRPDGTLRNLLREGLIKYASNQGNVLSKRQANHNIGLAWGRGFDDWLRLRVVDLSEADFGALEVLLRSIDQNPSEALNRKQEPHSTL